MSSPARSALPRGAAREIFDLVFGFAESFGAKLQSCSIAAKSRCGTSRSDANLLLEKIVDGLRIGLAAGGLHYLTDEPADRLRVCLGVGDLVRVLSDDVVDDLLDRREVGHLPQAALFGDDRAGIAALSPDDLEDVLGDFAGNGAVADQVENGAELRRRHR